MATRTLVGRPATTTSSGPAAAPRLLVGAAALATVGLTAVAFWLSYQHLAEIAAAHSAHGADARAWAWPATVDAFILVGELLILRASLAGRTDFWAIGLAVVGSGGSIALNVAGVGPDATRLDYVVAAVPPTAALVAFGALMRQLHEHLTTRHVAPTPSADVGPTLLPTSIVIPTHRYVAPPPMPAVPPRPAAAAPLPHAARDVTPDVVPDGAYVATSGVVYTNAVEIALRPLYDDLKARPTTRHMIDAMAAVGLERKTSTARDARKRIELREPALLDLPRALAV